MATMNACTPLWAELCAGLGFLFDGTRSQATVFTNVLKRFLLGVQRAKKWAGLGKRGFDE